MVWDSTDILIFLTGNVRGIADHSDGSPPIRMVIRTFCWKDSRECPSGIAFPVRLTGNVCGIADHSERTHREWWVADDILMEGLTGNGGIADTILISQGMWVAVILMEDSSECGIADRHSYGRTHREWWDSRHHSLSIRECLSVPSFLSPSIRECGIADGHSDGRTHRECLSAIPPF